MSRDSRIDLAEELFGAWWKSEGVTFLDIRGQPRGAEVDYHDRATAPRSLGIEVKR